MMVTSSSVCPEAIAVAAVFLVVGAVQDRVEGPRLTGDFDGDLERVVLAQAAECRGGLLDAAGLLGTDERRQVPALDGVDGTAEQVGNVGADLAHVERGSCTTASTPRRWMLPGTWIGSRAQLSRSIRVPTGGVAARPTSYQCVAPFADQVSRGSHGKWVCPALIRIGRG